MLQSLKADYPLKSAVMNDDERQDSFGFSIRSAKVRW